MLTLRVHCEPLNSNWYQKCECVVEFLFFSHKRLSVRPEEFTKIDHLCEEDSRMIFRRTCQIINPALKWSIRYCIMSYWWVWHLHKNPIDNYLAEKQINSLYYRIFEPFSYVRHAKPCRTFFFAYYYFLQETFVNLYKNVRYTSFISYTLTILHTWSLSFRTCYW